jgi:hypothetical protein
MPLDPTPLLSCAAVVPMPPVERAEQVTRVD